MAGELGAGKDAAVPDQEQDLCNLQDHHLFGEESQRGSGKGYLRIPQE